MRINEKLFAVALLLLALRFTAGCCGASCGRLTSFEIYLDADRSTLDGSVLTLCRNGSCSSGAPSWDRPVNGWERASFILDGDLPKATTSAYVLVEPNGQATVVAGVGIDKNVDQFDIQLADARGAALLNFSRSLRYDHRDFCGNDCPSGSIRVWPTSPAGLTCSARTCDSGAAVAADVMLPDGTADGTIVEICRNDVCSAMTKACRDSLCVPDYTSGFMGNLAAVMDDSPLGANGWHFRVIVRDDPAVLADGDRYRLIVTDRKGSIVASIDRVALYEETFPNGSDCDPYPCRWAEISP
jgi:hypothetical protein